MDVSYEPGIHHSGRLLWTIIHACYSCMFKPFVAFAYLGTACLFFIEGSLNMNEFPIDSGTALLHV